MPPSLASQLLHLTGIDSKNPVGFKAAFAGKPAPHLTGFDSKNPVGSKAAALCF
jgi:hypothetical protein